MYRRHTVNQSIFVIIHPICCYDNHKRKLGMMAGILVSPWVGAAAGDVCCSGPLIPLILLLILVGNDVMLSEAGVFVPPRRSTKAYMWPQNPRVPVGANVTFFCRVPYNRRAIIRPYNNVNAKAIEMVNSTTWKYHITGATKKDTNVYVCKLPNSGVEAFQYLEVIEGGTADTELKAEAPSTLDCVSEKKKNLKCTWNHQNTTEGAVSWQVSIWRYAGKKLKEFKCDSLTESIISFDAACPGFKFESYIAYLIMIEPYLNGEKVAAQVYYVEPRKLVDPGKIDGFKLTLGSRETVLSWTPPMDIYTGYLKYNITVYKAGDIIKSYPSQTSLSLDVTDLKPYTNYTAVVETRPRDEGFPTRSEVHWTTKQAAPDGPPSNVTLRCTSDSAKINWRPPAAPNGIINYTVTIAGRENELTRTTTDTSWHETDLVAYTDYQVKVMAVTPAGKSPSSVPQECKTEEKAPSPVLKLNVHGSYEKKSKYLLDLTWEPPEYPNSRSLTYDILVTWLHSNETVANETVPEDHQKTPEGQLNKAVEIECQKSHENTNVNVQVAAVSYLGMRSHWRSKELTVNCPEDQMVLLRWLIPLIVLVLLGLVVLLKFGKCKARVKNYFCIEPVFPDVDLNFQVQGENEYYWQCDEGIVATEEIDEEPVFSTDFYGPQLPSIITRPVNMQSADSGIMDRDSEDNSTENESQGMSNDIPYATIVGTIDDGADDREGGKDNRSEVMNRRNSDVSDTWWRQAEPEHTGDAETRAFSDSAGSVDLCTRHADDTDYCCDQYVTSRIHLTIPGENTNCSLE